MRLDRVLSNSKWEKFKPKLHRMQNVFKIDYYAVQGHEKKLGHN